MSDRVAVVTGANRGIGRAIAAALAGAGFTVAATARDPSTLDGTLRDVADAGGRAVPVGCDVRDEDSVGSLVETASGLGRVHTVVANAGVAGTTAPMHEISPAQWRDCLATDLDGVFLTFRGFVPGLIETGDGSLVAISSMTGKRPLHGRTPYAAAKMGVIGLVRTLAAELGPHGIRVNAICPGYIETEMNSDFWKTPAGQRLIDRIPQRRIGQPEHLDGALLLLASEAGSFMTGSVLTVDGGHTVSSL